MIDNIAYWYSNGGKRILLLISYYATIVVAVLSGLGTLIASIIMFTYGELFTTVAVILLVSCPVSVVLLLLVAALIKGEVYIFDNIMDGSNAAADYEKNIAAFKKVQPKVEPVKETVKPKEEVKPVPEPVRKEVKVEEPKAQEPKIEEPNTESKSGGAIHVGARVRLNRELFFNDDDCSGLPSGSVGVVVDENGLNYDVKFVIDGKEVVKTIFMLSLDLVD